jgi:alpha-galactosidase
VFRLATQHTSYWFQITRLNHLEHIYYGSLLPGSQPIEPFLFKRTAQTGGSVLYDAGDETYCLDTLLLEWSGIGKGDYRETPAELKMPDGTFTADFVYRSHEILEGSVSMDKLPSSYGEADGCQTLVITLKDESNSVTLLLYYTVYIKTDVITRRAVIITAIKSRLL